MTKDSTTNRIDLVYHLRPTRFKKLLDRYTDEELLSELFVLYSDQKKNKKGYSQVLKELRYLKPKLSSMTIRINWVKDKDADNGGWESVEGYSKGMDYVLMEPFEDWLGFWVDLRSVWRLGEKTYLAHCLWEMTWYGFSNFEVKKVRGKLDKAAKEILGKKYVS